MENNPTAAGEAPQAPQTEANPTPTNIEPTQTPVPNLHGFTEAQLEEMSKFYSANGGYEKGFARIKSAISNPQQFAQPQNPTSQPQAQPVEPQQPQQPQQPAYTPPQGSITPQEFLAQQYFQGLSRDPKYAPISEQIANGEVLKEMASFNIQPLNQDGSINDQMVRRYLDLKAQTVPAQGTSAEPNMSPAPTVEYVPVAESGITSMDQAFAVLDQDMKLKAQGLAGHPSIGLAEEYIKTGGKPAKK